LNNFPEVETILKAAVNGAKKNKKGCTKNLLSQAPEMDFIF
jgi:hypothetical protein